MCGIAGFVGRGDKQTLERMTRSLRYRGPDEEGFLFLPFPGGSVALGSRRLSIIDLRGGRQPIANEDGSIQVVQNGEIYNFRELRSRLQGRHTFRTQTDTEVIVHLYEEKGEACVEDLEGMFAFALWDGRRRRLYIARDRFGEKPLYYVHAGGSFFFGSEMKAVLLYDAARRELDRAAVAQYFFYEHIPAPHTIFAGMHKLPAAHYLTLENGKLNIKEYWNIIDGMQNAKCKMQNADEGEALRMLDVELAQAVEKMLVSDVPLGVFLSGGIDSSTIAYYAQRATSIPIQTFSIGFGEATFDETAYAERVAKRLSAHHRTRVFSLAEFRSAIPKIYALLDEPFADPSLVPTYLLSQFAREHVTVSLSGDGSDELFMGYQTFQAEKLAEWYQRVPGIVRRGISLLASRLPTSFSYLSFDYKLKRFVASVEYPSLIRNQLWIGAYTPRDISLLLGTDVSIDAVAESIEEHRARAASLDALTQLSYLYQKHYLQEYVLVKSDRASMFSSLEVRSPFLDRTLSEWVFSLPLRYKLRGFTTKYLLRKLMAPRLGRDIAFRAKHGFQPPVARWLRGELEDIVDAYLGEDRLRQEGLFRPAYVGRLLTEHRRGLHDHRKKLWALLVFQMWREKFLDV